MKCPHCAINFHANWVENEFSRDGESLRTVVREGGKERALYWRYRSAHCPGCGDIILALSPSLIVGGHYSDTWRQIYPIGANRGPVPAEVPPNIADDYVEACNVLPISAKASAALSRRCLQNMLHANGYVDRDLAKEIDLLLNEADPKKALSHKLRTTVDAIRNFGNFSAHPINDKTTLQVIDVEDHEAQWCLETIEELFEHFYVGPATAKAKKAALDAKLKAAGKLPSK